MSAASPHALLFAEPATLAHVTRPLLLAQQLRALGINATLCSSQEYRNLIESSGVRFVPLACQSSKSFLHSVRTGKRLFSESLLASYIEAELALLEEYTPDVVLGDLRVSLPISSQRAGIPYLSITNAYWGPYALRPRWPVPVYSFSTHLPLWLSRPLFGLTTETVLRFHAAPLQHLRRRYGQAAFDSFEDCFTHGDYTLYADVPSLVPHAPLPSNHKFIGPLSWAPSLALPDWWNQALQAPYAYVCLGSSGEVTALPKILKALQRRGLASVVATAGRGSVLHNPPKVFSAAFLPGAEMAARAALVVCNGGSPTVHQALHAGSPVLGVCSNMDQFLCMQGVEHYAAGLHLRADRLDARNLDAAISQVMQPAVRTQAQRIALEMRGYHAGEIVREVIFSLGKKALASQQTAA